MARVSPFKVGAVDDLFRELRFAPEATRLRQMRAAEELVASIDPQQNYPLDYIVFRITGYRPESDGTTLVGEALVGDLVNFVLRLSRSLDLSEHHEGRTALTIEEVASRLGVTRKTVQRYRKSGLVCHTVMRSDGARRVMCFADALKSWSDRNAQRTVRARSFTRLSAAEVAALVEEARTLHMDEGLSLNAAAKRLADAHDRAHETIRLVLKRHDRQADVPVFGEHGPLTPRDIRLIWRAHKWGVAVSRLMRRFNRTRAAIHRVINRERARRLRSLRLDYVALPTLSLPDADEVILGSPFVQDGFLQPAAAGNLVSIVSSARAAPPISEDTEAALIGGLNLLKKRARTMLEALDEDHPSSTELDRIDADLRWATLINRRLVFLALPAAIAAIEQNLHHPLQEQAGHRMERALREAVVLCESRIAELDPSRGQKLARVVSLAMDKACSRLDLGAEKGSARARHEGAGPEIEGLFEQIGPADAQSGLWLDSRFVAKLDELDKSDAMLIMLRYGLSGERPFTINEMGKRMKKPPSSVRRRLRVVESRLRTLARVPASDGS